MPPRKRAKKIMFATASAKKARRLELDRMRNLTRVSVGNELGRWMALKDKLRLSHPEVARLLLDSYEKLQKQTSTACFPSVLLEPATVLSNAGEESDTATLTASEKCSEVGSETDGYLGTFFDNFSEEPKVEPVELVPCTSGQEPSLLHAGTPVELPSSVDDTQGIEADQLGHCASVYGLVNKDSVSTPSNMVSGQTLEQLPIPGNVKGRVAYPQATMTIQHRIAADELAVSMLLSQSDPANYQTLRTQAITERIYMKRTNEAATSGKEEMHQSGCLNPPEVSWDHYSATRRGGTMDVSRKSVCDDDETRRVFDIELPLNEMPIKEEEKTSEEEEDDDDELKYFSGEEEIVQKTKMRVPVDPEWLPGCSSGSEMEEGDNSQMEEGNNSEMKDSDNSEMEAGDYQKKGGGKQKKKRPRASVTPPKRKDASLSCDPVPKKLKQSIDLEVFPCNICQDTFALYQFMVAHSINSHGNQEETKCGVCGYKWREVAQVRVQEITRHMHESHDLNDFVDPDTTKRDQYICKHCTFMCTIPLLFVFHLEECHEKTVFSCVKCEYKVIHRYQIYRHLDSKHEWGRCSPISEHIKVLQREMGYPKTHMYIYDYKAHKCKLCGKTMCNERIQTHIQSAHKAEVARQKFQCPDCSRTYGLYKQLSTHVHIKHRDNLNCHICQSTFPIQNRLKVHIERHHLGVMHYHCEFCDLYWFHKPRFKQHVSDVHEAIRNYLCASCGKGFKTHDALQVHTRIHTDEKPLKCKFCDYSCRQRNALNWHMKKHKDKVTLKDKELPSSKSRQLRTRRTTKRREKSNSKRKEK